ncbi:MAG: RNA polymerase sigma factor [Pseudomonadota bacterium]
MNGSITSEMAALVPRLRRFAYALAADREEGDDIVQTACMKALSRLDQFEPGTRLDSWMFRIVQTTFLDHRRQQGRRSIVALDAEDAAFSDGGYAMRRAENRAELDRVRAAMASLAEDQRSVLTLVAIEGFSYRETAEILSLPVGTVMSRLSRARQRLLALMAEGAA